MHFTIKAPSDSKNERSPIFGAFIRYNDAFNHYRIKIDTKTQTMVFSVVTFKEYKVILKEKFDAIKLDA